MKKYLVFILAALLLAACFAGCTVTIHDGDKLVKSAVKGVVNSLGLEDEIIESLKEYIGEDYIEKLSEYVDEDTIEALEENIEDIDIDKLEKYIDRGDAEKLEDFITRSIEKADS